VPSRPVLPVYRPQLAELVTAPPEGAGWVHETKYDGYRIGAAVEGGRVTLWSRRGKDWTAQLPEVAAAALALPARSALLDGEVAAVLPDGRTSFQALQNAFSGPRRDLRYFVFDLLFLDGEDLSGLPLRERKARLEALLQAAGPVICFAPHVAASGPAVLREACRLGLEGVVSKRADEPYRWGRRGGWTKAKCVARQELVIGGFTDPEGSRDGLGALLVGVRQAGALRYAGKVGTGFTNASARALRARLEPLQRSRPPFDPPPGGWLGRNAHWVEPVLVAEVVFTEWTQDGKVRHPSFQGLREDKRADEVVRESPAASGEGEPRVLDIRISHPDRVMYPEPGLTKLQLARYAESVAEAMVPHVRGRPLTLVHCPEGIAGECRFMKHSKLWAPAALRRVRIQEKTKLGEYLVADGPEALVALVQMDVLEVHTWNSTVDRLEEPDRIVLDLDPGPAVPFGEVVAAARMVRGALEAMGMASFAKTTGGVGLHVVVPIAPVRPWQECLAFARGLAAMLVRHAPDRFTTAFAVRGRERKILIDFLRNNRTNTSIAAFSTRARPGAPVSVPVAWDELGPRLRPDRFTVRTVPRRLASLRADPWAGYATAARPLDAARLQAVGAEAAPR
jgi:bifunctional non-homologous end joining protein LigD